MEFIDLPNSEIDDEVGLKMSNGVQCAVDARFWTGMPV